MTPTPTPTPIPAEAPSESPDEPDDSGESVVDGDEVADSVALANGVSKRFLYGISSVSPLAASGLASQAFPMFAITK